MPVERDALVAAMTAALPSIVDDIETLVVTESPSADLEAVARSATVVADLGKRLLGSSPERIVLQGRTHLRWRLGGGDGGRDGGGDGGGDGGADGGADGGGDGGADGEPAKVLVLAHHDTVWPLGTLETHPFSISAGVMRGPGCFDMKAGLVLAMHAIAALDDPSGVALLVTGDEELGSPTSRSLIESSAAGCRAALVLEASADGGALKTARKGVSLYSVQALGRAAHAGLEPEQGVNATIELAHQVHAVAALSDPSSGTTVTPTVLSSGVTTNTVPASGSFSVDARMWSAREQSRVDEAMRFLRPIVSGAELTVSGGPNRPPLQSSSSASLFAGANALAVSLGLGALSQAAVGGASDGNFTAGVGTPTLDGLGAVGGGAHADTEHVLVGELPGRAALLAALIEDLLRD